MTMLHEASTAMRLGARMKNLLKVNLLSLDELGYISFTAKKAQFLFDVIAKRSEMGGQHIRDLEKKARQGYFLAGLHNLLTYYCLFLYYPELSYVRAVTPDVEYQRTTPVRKFNLTANIAVICISSDNKFPAI